MGAGGVINLINATPYNWIRDSIDSYQMNTWTFPDSIPSGQVVSQYIEFSGEIFETTSDDVGNLVYRIDGTPDSSFHTQAAWRPPPAVTVDFNQNSSDTSHMELGFRHDSAVAFILSGEYGNYRYNNAPTEWMQSTLDIIGNLNLREISIPASHDSGMAEDNGGTLFASDKTTKTQNLNVAGQLEMGIRWFDIRPCISNGNVYTGHYGNTGSAIGWQGRNGQKLSDIVDQVNSFLATNKELVILEVSHGYQTDEDYRDFGAQEWDQTFMVLEQLKNRYVANITDLTTVPISNFIGSSGSVVVISRDWQDLTGHMGKGIYPDSAMPTFNSYADSDDAGYVMTNQIEKMKTWQSQCSTCKLFLLAWTSTIQGFGDTITTSIEELAFYLAGQAGAKTIPESTKTNFPNVIEIDYVSDHEISATCMAFNYLRSKV